MQELDSQLVALSAVRSPYAGTIKKVKWLEQADQNLRVELTLDLSGKSSPQSAPAAPTETSKP
ncbi:hypothetical protein [Neosynechococcus sphagnicola]|uniref:hypothetical protein n=1 Tax=Neosynechococcus sphagnicola TaxID=1501145 RepID=UPI00068CD599|nr:hypothetical protein [Neosynechococcus sphagnicola]